MNTLNLCWPSARCSEAKTPVRELTAAELDDVSGGAIPVVILIAVAVAAVVHEATESSSSESEDSESNEDD